MKKVVVITTGGTIAMRHDPELGVVPAVSGEELVQAVPGLAAFQLEVVEFANVPSPHMTPEMMFQLASLAEAWLAKDSVCGVVVTHGTDTLEETAYFLDMAVSSEKPVCVTGAMRSAGEPGADGPVNMLSAVRVAACPEAVGMGTLVVLNNEVHAARDVRKTHAARVSTFASPLWGPIGEVDEDRIIFRRALPPRVPLCPRVPEYNVHLVTLAAGVDSLVIDFLVERNVRGIVVEAFGRGNMHPDAVEGIRNAVAKGIPVVLTSRTFAGRVLDVYGYPGSARDALDAGAFCGYDLPGHKARLRLMLVLGITHNADEIMKYFED